MDHKHDLCIHKVKMHHIAIKLINFYLYNVILKDTPFEILKIQGKSATFSFN